MSAVAAIIDDIVAVVALEDLADELDADARSEADVRRKLIEEIGTLPPYRVVAWCDEHLGKMAARGLHRRAESGRPGRELTARQMLVAWMESRGIPIPQLKTRPATLLGHIDEQLQQFEGQFVLDVANKLSPDTETLMRLISLYFSAVFPTDSRLAELIDVLTGWGSEDAKEIAKKHSTAGDALENLSLTGLGLLLSSMELTAREPYSSLDTEICEVLPASEREQLHTLAHLRNLLAHGKATLEDAKEFCEVLAQLLASWEERGAAATIVPLGAVAYAEEPGGMTRAMACVDEHGKTTRLLMAPDALNVGDVVLVAAHRSGQDVHADRIEAVPDRGAWGTPRVSPA